MTRRFSIVLALAALATCPSAARADSRLVPAEGPLASGPALAGDALAWVSRTPSGSLPVLVAGADGAVRTIGEIPPPVRGHAGALLAASADRIALAEETTDSDGHFTSLERKQVLTGPMSGPLERLAGCDTASQCGRSSPCIGLGLDYGVDVSGPVVAYNGGCLSEPLTVVDYGSSPPATQTLPHVELVKVAGRYLAWLAGDAQRGVIDTLVVYDRVQGREVYRVPLTNQGIRTSTSFDVQDDGKVALIDGGRLAWTSAAEPSLHYLPGDVTLGAVHIASDRIAVASRPIRHLYRDLSVYDLAGTRLTGTRAERADGGFDFDGRRLAFASRPCETAFLTSWDLSSAVPPAPPAGRCPVPSLGAKTLRPDATGTFGVPLSCPAAPALGCAGRLHLVASGRRGRKHGRRDLGGASYAFPSARTAVARFKLNDAASRFLRRYRRLKVTATAIGASRAEAALSGDFLVSQSKFELRRR